MEQDDPPASWWGNTCKPALLLSVDLHTPDEWGSIFYSFFTCIVLKFIPYSSWVQTHIFAILPYLAFLQVPPNSIFLFFISSRFATVQKPVISSISPQATLASLTRLLQYEWFCAQSPPRLTQFFCLVELLNKYFRFSFSPAQLLLRMGKFSPYTPSVYISGQQSNLVFTLLPWAHFCAGPWEDLGCCAAAHPMEHKFRFGQLQQQ